MFVGKKFWQEARFTSALDGHIVEEVGSQATGSPKNTCLWSGAIEDGLPLGFEEWEVVIAEPILVVEQYESGDLAGMFSQEAFDGVGLDGQAIEQSVAKFFEVRFFEVFWAAVGGIGTSDVDAPKVIVLDWEF